MNPTDYSEFVIRPELDSEFEIKTDALQDATEAHYRNINVQFAEAFLAGCTAVDLVHTRVDGTPSTRVLTHWHEHVTDDEHDVVDPREIVSGDVSHVERYNLSELSMNEFDEFMKQSDIEYFELEPFKLLNGQK